MKLLLTSGGIQNKTIHNGLLKLLNKPIEECVAICISTANYAYPDGHIKAYEFISGKASTPMCDLGWKTIGVMELSILPVIDKSMWMKQLEEADVLLVNGGDPLFLNYMMNVSGVADVLLTLDIVYVGLSAGSMIMSPNIGKAFVRWQQPDQTDKTIGLVDFAMFPHLGHPMLPHNTLENAKKWAATMTVPCYAIDDDTAFLVVDDEVTILSEGTWEKLQ